MLSISRLFAITTVLVAISSTAAFAGAFSGLAGAAEQHGEAQSEAKETARKQQRDKDYDAQNVARLVAEKAAGPSFRIARMTLAAMESHNADLKRFIHNEVLNREPVLEMYNGTGGNGSNAWGEKSAPSLQQQILEIMASAGADHDAEYKRRLSHWLTRCSNLSVVGRASMGTVQANWGNLGISGLSPTTLSGSRVMFNGSQYVVRAGEIVSTSASVEDFALAFTAPSQLISNLQVTAANGYRMSFHIEGAGTLYPEMHITEVTSQVTVDAARATVDKKMTLNQTYKVIDAMFQEWCKTAHVDAITFAHDILTNPAATEELVSAFLAAHNQPQASAL